MGEGDVVVDAIVLAGGEGTRLGGIDKASVPVGGRTMLEHVLDAATAAQRVVVVGPANVETHGHARVQEDPPLGGPAAGVAAGIGALAALAPEDAQAPVVLVLACDQPLARAAVGDLLDALAGHPGADGAVLIAEDGHRQALLGAYRTAALGQAVARLARGRGTHGASMRALVADLTLVEVPDVHGAAQDGDTWADVEALTARLGGTHG